MQISNVVVRQILYKSVLILLVVVLGAVLTYVLELQWGWQSAGEWILLLMLLSFWGLTRVFRGITESDAPRPRWRMTERPPLGYGIGVFFIVIGGSNLLTAAILLNLPQILAYTAMTVLGALYFRSSFKLYRGSQQQ